MTSTITTAPLHPGAVCDHCETPIASLADAGYVGPENPDEPFACSPFAWFIVLCPGCAEKWRLKKDSDCC